MKLLGIIIGGIQLRGIQSRHCECRSSEFLNLVNLRNASTSHKKEVVTGLGPELRVFDPEEGQDTEVSKHLEIKNSCSFPIYLGMTGSEKGPAVFEKCGIHQLNNGRGRCFWFFENVPSTLEGGEKWEIALRSSDDHVFSGNVWGIRKIDQLMEQACSPTGCTPWIGPRGAVTKAEFTFSKSKNDYYDISIIEGANIPMAMYPAKVVEDDKDGDIYNCGIAGGCKWSFEPEDLFRIHVTEVIPAIPESKCENDSDCEGDLTCGSTFHESLPKYGVCGEFNGYASAHVNCNSGSTGAPFFCEKHHDVISCMGKYHLSGYNQPHGTTVCGCPDWESMGIDAPSTVPCQATDENWEKNSLPFLVFLKKGCPNAYEFAYSDMTSTFICSTSPKYVIEFCPGDSESLFFDERA